MKCPHCGSEQIQVVKMEFQCNRGHHYSEEVELPQKDEPIKPPMMNLTGKRPGSHLDQLTMPFGKYKGELIEHLDTEYIIWCLENLERLSDRLKAEMENQLKLRRGEGVLRKEPE